jgi:hypothetical protein
MSSSSWGFSTLDELQGFFGLADYAVLVIVLLLSVLIGVIFAWRGQRSTDDYLTASGDMSMFPMTLSLACSFISAITILGTPAEMYVFGTQYWMIGKKKAYKQRFFMSKNAFHRTCVSFRVGSHRPHLHAGEKDISLYHYIRS